MYTYITNYNRKAIDHWSNYEAVREFVQNALDSEGEFEFEIVEGIIVLISKNIKVSNKMLMTGLSDKRDDPTKRGQYGTGSMFALCVLTARGVNVTMQNNDLLWDARFEYCDKFEDDIMVIDETVYYPSNDFTVTIQGLSEEDIEDVKQICLMFQDREVVVSTEYGNIINSVDDQGEVYCGGLFVQQTKGFKYSYDIKPEHLSLNQDRQSCSEWDLQTLTAKIIMSSGDKDLIRDAVESNQRDTSHVTYNYAKVPEELSDEYAEEFIEEHGGSLVTNSYSDHRESEELGNKSVYLENGVKVKAIQSSSTYKEAIANIELIEKKSPQETMEELKEEIVERLCAKVNAELVSEIVDLLDEVVDTSSDWRD